MVVIGNSGIPGTTVDIQSSTSIGIDQTSPGASLIIGQGNFANGSGESGEVYTITRSRRATELFGKREESLLTQAVQDALSEGGYPIYAIGPSRESVSSEDLSGDSGNTGTLDEDPVYQDPETINFTVNGSSMDTVLYFEENPHDATPGSGEVLINPVTGEFNSDEELGNSGDEVSYMYLDFEPAFSAMREDKVSDDVFLRDIIDLVGLLNENSDVVDTFRSEIESMADEGGLSIGIAGAGTPYIGDTTDYDNPFDYSRIQLLAPSRKGNGRETTIGGYIGERSKVGIETSPMFNRLTTVRDTLESFNVDEIKDLIDNKVTPLQELSGGAKIYHDITTVSDDNTDESAWQFASARLITDFVAETVREIADRYVGQYNYKTKRESLETEIGSELDELLVSRIILEHSLTVEAVSNTEVAVDVGVDTTEPITNIDATLAAGDVSGGVTIEGGN